MTVRTPDTAPASHPGAGWVQPVARLLQRSASGATLGIDPAAAAAMRRASNTIHAWNGPVYGLTSGFGPLVGNAANPDALAHANNLIAHLTVGQGPSLPPAVVRTMVWLRLSGMALGHSGVDPELWQALVDQWNVGFTPVVPADGSLSASGDLIPLAHAAAATAGQGLAVLPDGAVVTAAEALSTLGVQAVRWDARSSLAFVNGTSACLALALHNHLGIGALSQACAAVTARLVGLLGCSQEPYSDEVAQVRGHAGHRTAAALIRSGIAGSATDPARPLQEPYSLRCAPQVIGAVLDQLRYQGDVLVTEARGCTDNPVVVGGAVWHGGNFHAAPVGLASEQHVVCAHQLAFLAERQLALVLDPRHNGDRPPLLAAAPGGTSGFGGVQLAATSHLGAIRQRCLPASTTAVPTNLGNQDHVPLALNSAVAVADILRRSWWIVGSLMLAVTQLGRLASDVPPGAGLWQALAARHADLSDDRPLAGEIAEAARLAEETFTDEIMDSASTGEQR